MSDQRLQVSEPTIRQREYHKPLLCGAGPCDMYPSVYEALSLNVITPLCEEYFQVINDINAGLKYVFQTKSDLVLAVSGSGHAGMEAAICNLVAPGEVFLIALRGIWDERAFAIAKRHGLDVRVTKVPANTTFSMEQLEDSLAEHRPVALFITHGDSSTGTVQNLNGLGDLCHKYGALLIVDTVVSLIGEPFFMDTWGVDAAFTATQKAFSGPAGIAPVAFSSRAEKIINNRKHEPPFYFDIKLLAKQWNCYGDTRAYHHTLSSPLIQALRACLREIVHETLPVIWARHASTLQRFHEKLKLLDVEFYVPNPSERLTTVTLLTLPNGYDVDEFTTYMRDKHAILIYSGRGPTAGNALRIGNMGVNATNEVVDAIIAAMRDTLAALAK